ncbi:hypothetical protein CLU79DRAFT_779096 [Phycomyces nitens]|nr:hypothetical protein CLU79DRAFT_779096 [Phycomyces nitens]
MYNQYPTYQNSTFQPYMGWNRQTGQPHDNGQLRGQPLFPGYGGMRQPPYTVTGMEQGGWTQGNQWMPAVPTPGYMVDPRMAINGQAMGQTY